jgi:hypothetical protein
VKVDEETTASDKSAELAGTGVSANKTTSNSSSPNLARWFWGSIILMAVASIVLSVAAALRLSDYSRDVTGSPPSMNGGTSDEPVEQSASELKRRLNTANKSALEAVTLQIGPLLDAAYQPAYDAIPSYANFHYSVWGEYAELGAAALGDVGVKLQEMLFNGLDGRLREVGIGLDQSFNSRFETELNAFTDNGGSVGASLGPLTRLALQDAKTRMVITVPVSTAAAIGTAATIKVAATSIAKKIAAKLAIKAAAKTGGKWAAAGTGAGVGGAACWWAGPGAGLCAAVGGVGAWIVADYGIVKLDEYWNRDEFEADLRGMIDEQKASHKSALAQALAARAIAVQEVSNEIVQRHDFTLRELSGIGNAEICKVAAEQTESYELMRVNLAARKPAALQAILSAVAENSDSPSLGPMMQEMGRNLKGATLVSVSTARIEGNLPLDFRSDRDVSGLFYLDGATVGFARKQTTEIGGFNVSIAPGIEIRIDKPLSISVVIEQHLRIWTNQYFGGSVRVKLLDAIGTSGGLEHRIKLTLPITHDPNAENIGEVEVTPREQTGQTTVDLTLQLRGKPLAEIKKMRGC